MPSIRPHASLSKTIFRDMIARIQFFFHLQQPDYCPVFYFRYIFCYLELLTSCSLFNGAIRIVLFMLQTIAFSEQQGSLFLNESFFLFLHTNSRFVLNFAKEILIIHESCIYPW